LNQLSGRKVGGPYGARKAEISEIFQQERESAGVERSRISRRFKSAEGSENSLRIVAPAGEFWGT